MVCTLYFHIFQTLSVMINYATRPDGQIRHGKEETYRVSLRMELHSRTQFLYQPGATLWFDFWLTIQVFYHSKEFLEGNTDK